MVYAVIANLGEIDVTSLKLDKNEVHVCRRTLWIIFLLEMTLHWPFAKGLSIIFNIFTKSALLRNPPPSPTKEYITELKMLTSP